MEAYILLAREPRSVRLAKRRRQMNLTKDPKESELRNLLALCDDEAGHHIVWVDKQGEVHINVCPEDLTPGSWHQRNRHNVRVRLETLPPGGGYVGREASHDAAWVSRLLEGLQKAWASGEEYVDTF
jgi:hypothetical protein